MRGIVIRKRFVYEVRETKAHGGRCIGCIAQITTKPDLWGITTSCGQELRPRRTRAAAAADLLTAWKRLPGH